MMRKVVYLARDFVKIARGKDYFHQPQPLGQYFTNPRCYYNDLRGKAHWTGAVGDERVPLLFLPTRKRHVHFPIMILQYGLGSFDCYSTTGEVAYLGQAADATRWVLRNLNSEGHLDNLFPELAPGGSFHSANSGMGQGEALSLLTRVHRERVASPELVPQVAAEEVEQAIRSIYGNMIKPLEQNGTALHRGGSLVFCEVCRRDDFVILNGWVFALFGILDYWRWSQDGDARRIFDGSVDLMAKDLRTFSAPGGWSFYDNKRSISSPFYHKLHIDLLDAMSRLTGHPALGAARDRFTRGFSIHNRAWFTARKVVDKLTDSVVYSTDG